MVETININVTCQGLLDVTPSIVKVVSESPFEEGICHVFIQHTSASLLIQENYDASAKQDLENWLNRLVPENDRLYTHTLEGPDDMPAHIKSALTASCLPIPVVSGALALGTWQGIFLWEHRHSAGSRNLLVHLSP